MATVNGQKALDLSNECCANASVEVAQLGTSRRTPEDSQRIAKKLLKASQRTKKFPVTPIQNQTIDRSIR